MYHEVVPIVFHQQQRLQEARKELYNMQNTFKSVIANPSYDEYNEQILAVEKLKM